MGMMLKGWIGCLLAMGITAASTASDAAPDPAIRTAHISSHALESRRAAHLTLLKLAQGQSAPPAPAPATTTPDQTPAASIGTVVSVQGNAMVERNGANLALKANDEIFKSDTLKTAADSALGVIFDDETTFNLRANASITIDDFVYQEGGDKNYAAIAVLAGTVAFVASAVAKTGDMTIATPVSTLGIRGTTGLVEVVPSGSGAVTDSIKLYPDPDGHVGRIEIRGHDGTALGVLTRGATGFAIRGGIGVRPTAVGLRISPQQAARDQTIVRQTHLAQSSGRAVVQQRRQRPPGVPGSQQQRPQQSPTQQGPQRLQPQQRPTQQRPQQLRPQQSPTQQRPIQLNPALPKQGSPPPKPAGPGLQPQQQLQAPPPQQPQRQVVQPQRPGTAPRLAVPPGRKPPPTQPQKKRKPE
jgi:hypothetical protein